MLPAINNLQLMAKNCFCCCASFINRNWLTKKFFSKIREKIRGLSKRINSWADEKISILAENSTSKARKLNQICVLHVVYLCLQQIRSTYLSCCTTECRELEYYCTWISNNNLYFNSFLVVCTANVCIISFTLYHISL